jgi:hypothetical protein
MLTPYPRFGFRLFCGFPFFGKEGEIPHSIKKDKNILSLYTRYTIPKLLSSDLIR